MKLEPQALICHFYGRMKVHEYLKASKRMDISYLDNPDRDLGTDPYFPNGHVRQVHAVLPQGVNEENTEAFIVQPYASGRSCL